MLKNTRLVVAVLAATALVLGGLIYRDVFVGTKSASTTLNLYTVARRTVTASVTGTGNLVPMTQANLSFKVSGTLTDIEVRVGDHVSTGQVLARIDPVPEQQALAAAQANVAIAQANLQSAETPLTSGQISQLQHNVAMAQQSYDDTASQVNATNVQDADQVATDQSQLNADLAAYNTNVVYQDDVSKLNLDQQTLSTARTTWTNDLATICIGVSYPYSSVPQCSTDYQALLVAQIAVNSDQGKVNLDRALVNADQTKLNQDTQKQQSDRNAGQRSLNQAAASVTSAQDQLNTQTTSKPNQILSAKAQLASAQAALQAAQQNLSNTTLISPMDGQVNSINGVVGETAGTGSGTTAQAPGTAAPLPTNTASNAFMVIGNVSAMEVVIPFAESDASKLAFNQETQVTFDAVPNLTISGHVIAVGSAATVQSGVVNYYATVALNQTNPGLKEGMTSNATVTVSQATNAITVPNLAITRLGGQAYVNVYVNGQQVQTPIDTGVVGDQYTEVVGGLDEGAKVVIPTLRVSTTSGGGRGGGGGTVRIGG